MLRELVGRGSEQAQLAASLEAAREGVSGVLVLEGDPGIGKSALLQWAIAQASDFHIVESRGMQAEVELPFGGVGQLIAPFRDLFAKLDGKQASVLEAVLALTGRAGASPTPTSVPDQFAVGAAVLALLASAAEGGPVLAVVDDAQWLDQSSVEGLAFVARRVLAEGILLLLSRRTADGGQALDGLPAMRIEGLDAGAGAELLARSGAKYVGAGRAGELVASLAGNPLALLELPRLLDPRELAGLVPVPAPMPVGATLQEAYAGACGRLSERAQRAVLIVSMLEDADLRLVQRSLNLANLAMRDLAEGEDIELIGIGSERVSFRHPLARSAISHSAPPSRRREAHAAIGGALRDATSLQQRVMCAWHLAAASAGPDEETAAALEQVADEAGLLTGYAAAAAAYERAAHLSLDDANRYRRLLRAAEAASYAGQITRGLALLDAAEERPVEDAPTKVAAAGVRCRLVFARGDMEAALAIARKTADHTAATHPIETAQLLVEGAAAACFIGDTDVAKEVAGRAVELSRADPFALAMTQAALGCILLIRGESEEGLPLVAPIANLPPEMLVSQPDNIPHVARIAFCVSLAEDFATADALSGAVLKAIRASGLFNVLSWTIGVRGFSDLRRGRWPGARAAMYEGLGLARDMGRQLEVAQSLSIVALAEAYRGEADLCRQQCQEGLTILEGDEAAAAAIGLHYALGVLELGLHDLPRAIAALEASRRICERTGILEMGNWQWPTELAEAYTRAGRFDDAAEVVGMLEWHAGRTRRPIIQAFAARCRGFNAGDDYAADFEDALHWHSQSVRPFELARTQLCFGERLRRDKKKSAARKQLEPAWVTFRELGAVPWAQWAEVELAAVGVTVTGGANDARTALLTPQELQVAMAVAGGATNREVAEQLFLSSKTIEYHLSRVFRKLDIASRGKLGEALSVA
ncbi:MAG TPA: LuxR family transcriptional regulator [Frankiaceae bacterium]|nr:LuxR family transcriptional regulator [Frankiaceae bacterium]